VVNSNHPQSGSSAPKDHDPTSQHCDAALARAFSFLGKRWNGVILGSLVTGGAGFSELKRRVEGISDSVLSDRLSELQGVGLIIRTVQEGPPVSVSYALSHAGAELIPVMSALGAWASANFVAHSD
jgi:DNA-binding HxlR family transcriptional regulator